MHPSIHAAANPDKPAYIMAASGETVTWDGVDVIPFDANGLIARKDVYSDSVSILRQVGLL